MWRLLSIMPYKCRHEYQLYTRHKTSLVSIYFVFALTLIIDTGKARCDACCERNASSQKCFMCTFSARNISSPNSLKMWKLCEHTTFIDNVFTIISNAILCHVVFSFHNLISCCVYIFSFLFLVVYMQTSKKWFNTQL